MTREDLIAVVAKKSGYTKPSIDEALKHIFKEIDEVILGGGSIRIGSLGVLSGVTIKGKTRKYRNPLTEHVVVENRGDYLKIKFKPAAIYKKIYKNRKV